MSLSAVQEAVNAIDWVNQLSCWEPIAQSPLVQPTLASVKRNLAKPKIKKEPVIVDMLAALVQSLGTSPSVAVLRLAASCFLAFAAFLQYDELSRLRCCDISFLEDSKNVHIHSSKTDYYWQSDTVLVACTNSQPAQWQRWSNIVHEPVCRISHLSCCSAALHAPSMASSCGPQVV